MTSSTFPGHIVQLQELARTHSESKSPGGPLPPHYFERYNNDVNLCNMCGNKLPSCISVVTLPSLKCYIPKLLLSLKYYIPKLLLSLKCYILLRAELIALHRCIWISATPTKHIVMLLVCLFV